MQVPGALKKYFPHFFPLSAVAVSAFTMKGRALSDDQITYWIRSEIIADSFHRHLFSWDVTSSFSLLLAVAHRWLADPSACFIAVYTPIAILYFYSMKWSLDYFLKNSSISFLVSLVSIAPLYTLAMTYWGFAGFEFIKSRILIMPLVPVIFRLFFQWEDNKKIWIPFFLCGLGMILSLEIMYLLLALSLYLLVLSMATRTSSSQRRRAIVIAIYSVAAIVFIYWLELFLLIHNPTTLSSFDDAPYPRLIQVYEGFIYELTNKAYVDLVWQASYAAFWWTMFPLRGTDLLFALFNAMFLLPLAAAGFLILKNEGPRLFWKVIGLMGCICVTAFAYQVLRFIGWKLFDWRPHILEEYRAVKFLYFPLYLAAGLFLKTLWMQQKKMWVFVLAALLCIPPLAVLRNLPQPVKQQIVQNAHAAFRLKPQQDEYLEKALQFRDPGQKEDIEKMIDILQAMPSDSTEFVLSDIHALSLSGKRVMLSYQNKRAGRPIGNKEDRKFYLPYWYLAYSEISAALHSGNADRLIEMARKYGCKYIAAEQPVKNEGWKCLYTGQRYNLYCSTMPE
jgi:hypothetical protein